MIFMLFLVRVRHTEGKAHTKKQTKNKKNETTEEKYENKVIGVVVAIIIVSLETIYITFFFYFLTSLSHLLLLIKASEHLQGETQTKKR